MPTPRQIQLGKREIRTAANKWRRDRGGDEVYLSDGVSVSYFVYHYVMHGILGSVTICECGGECSCAMDYFNACVGKKEAPRRRRSSKKKRVTKNKSKKRYSWPRTIDGVRYANYNKYLQGDWWRSRRAIFAQEFEMRCGYCEKECEKPNLHHLTYKNIGMEQNEDLAWLCQDCHLMVHANDFRGELTRFPK